MLILTRRPEQTLEIGAQRITIRILSVTGGRVRLGIEAPKSLPVNRLEAKPGGSADAIVLDQPAR